MWYERIPAWMKWATQVWGESVEIKCGECVWGIWVGYEHTPAWIKWATQVWERVWGYCV